MENPSHSRSQGIYHHFVDFSNVFKAFIGSAYLALPFGFAQAGYILSTITLLVMLVITDHCCQVLVRAKKRIVNRMCVKYVDEGRPDVDTYRAHLLKKLSYSDIGRYSLGKPGVVIVDVFLFITQTGFCIAYFIFIGTTIYSLFPLVPITLPMGNSTPTGDNLSVFERDSLFKNDSTTTTVSMATTTPFLPTTTSLPHSTTAVSNLSALSSITPSSSTGAPTTTSSVTPILINSTAAHLTTANGSHTTTVHDHTTTPHEYSTWMPLRPSKVSSAPSSKYLVLIPLIPFILFAFLRDLRKMGPISFIGNVAVFIGYAVILITMIIGFKVRDSVLMFNWSTFPVFFGQVACAFEGIGLIIPVEASMEGNNHNFPMFLHGCLAIVGAMLASFGLLGYLRYGSTVDQVIIHSLPNSGVITFTVDITLIIAVLFTYPMQVFPVCSILEKYIFGTGGVDVHGAPPEEEDSQPPSSEMSDDDEFNNSILSDYENSLNRSGSDEEDLLIKPAIVKPPQVAVWKSNILRTFVVLCICGLAVLLRHNFAYINAFVGSLGSTSLAYTLPCIFHLIVRKGEIKWFVIMKDIIIIIVGILGSIVGVIIVTKEIIESFSIHKD